MSRWKTVRDRLALRRGTDMAGTVSRVAAGARLSAENLWMLGCSAMLASIGLDVGSAAVVIGAMLISPLMGPILGMGLGIGVTDRALLADSLRELGVATVLVLVVSSVYFLLSPLAAPTTEIIARTRPTLLDVAVAFFGGVAGIVAGSRKQPSIAIPGVAIATALMPPLCTAGFGLATANPAFFLSAFYLYVLNAVFIALATFLTVRLLRFPHHEEATPEARLKERRLVTVVAVVAALPSVFFLYEAARGVREQRRIATFVQREIVAPGRGALQWEHEHGRDAEVLKVYVAGRPVEDTALAALQTRLPRYQLGGMTLELVQSDISDEEFQRFQGEIRRDLLRAATVAAAARDSAAQVRERDEAARMRQAARELVQAFPEIVAVSYVPRLDLLAPDTSPSPPAVLVAFAPRTGVAARRSILTRSEALLRARLGAADLVVQVR